MSYTVTFKAKHIQPWFTNAWTPVFQNSGKGELKHIAARLNAWTKTYNTMITLEENPEYEWTVTFPSEKDYTWFVLKWS